MSFRRSVSFCYIFWAMAPPWLLTFFYLLALICSLIVFTDVKISIKLYLVSCRIYGVRPIIGRRLPYVSSTPGILAEDGFGVANFCCKALLVPPFLRLLEIDFGLMIGCFEVGKTLARPGVSCEKGSLPMFTTSKFLRPCYYCFVRLF